MTSRSLHNDAIVYNNPADHRRRSWVGAAILTLWKLNMMADI